MKFVIAALIVIVIAIAAFAGFCFDYSLFCCFGCDVPFLVDCIAGVVLPAVNIPAALACWIAVLCGVPTPFFV